MQGENTVESSSGVESDEPNTDDSKSPKSPSHHTSSQAPAIEEIGSPLSVSLIDDGQYDAVAHQEDP